jgi:hypothetical protein
MTHLIMAMYASPDSQEEFMRKINQWRYEVEGKYRKGKVAPYVSELKFYDIRIPEDCVDRFLNDTRAQTIDDLSGQMQYIQKNKIKKLMFWIFKRIIKKLGLEVKKPERTDKIFGLKFWHNFYCLAKLKDDECSNILTGEKREVL